MQISQNQGSSWSWLCDWPYWPQHVVNSELHIHTLVLNCHAYDMVLNRALNKFCCNLCQRYQPYICYQLLFLHWIHPNTAPYILLSLATRPHIVKQNSTPDIYSFGTEAGFLKKLGHSRDPKSLKFVFWGLFLSFWLINYILLVPKFQKFTTIHYNLWNFNIC